MKKRMKKKTEMKSKIKTMKINEKRKIVMCSAHNESERKKRKPKCCSQINRMRCNIFSFKQAYP